MYTSNQENIKQKNLAMKVYNWVSVYTGDMVVKTEKYVWN